MLIQISCWGEKKYKYKKIKYLWRGKKNKKETEHFTYTESINKAFTTWAHIQLSLYTGKILVIKQVFISFLCLLNYRITGHDFSVWIASSLVSLLPHSFFSELLQRSHFQKNIFSSVIFLQDVTKIVLMQIILWRHLHTKVPVFILTMQRKNCFVKKWIVKYQHKFLVSQYEFWTNLTKNKEKDTFLYVDLSSSNLKEISEKKVEKAGNSHEEVKKKINSQEIWIKEGLKLMVHHSSTSVKLILVVFFLFLPNLTLY